MPASQGRSSEGVASSGGLLSGRRVPARTSTVRVPAPVSQRRSTPSRTVAPCRSSACTSAGSRSEGCRTTITCESARAANFSSASVRAPCFSTTTAGSSAEPGATNLPHTTTMPGPCHSSKRWAMSRQAARELSVGSGGSRRSPMTSTRRPSATGTVRSAVAGGRRRRRRSAGRSYPRFSFGFHSPSIVSPSTPPAPPQLGGFPSAERRRRRRLPLRARNQARRPMPSTGPGTPGPPSRAGAGRLSSSTSTGSCPTPPAASTSWTAAGGGGTGPPSSRPAETTR